MSIWLWLVGGLFFGLLPSVVTEVRFRPWWAWRWWWGSFGIAFVCVILPFGVVLIMFLSASAFDAVEEMWAFLWSDEFGWVTGLGLGWLVGSGLMAWVHRHAPRLQGPPMSEEVK